MSLANPFGAPSFPSGRSRLSPDWLNPPLEDIRPWHEHLWEKVGLGVFLALLVAIPSVEFARDPDARLAVNSAFLIAILAASWWGGLIGGLAATIPSIVTVYHWFVPPYVGWDFPTAAIVPFASFLLAAAVLTAFNVWRHREIQKSLRTLREIARREEEVRRDADLLRAANLAKDAFLSSVSHELKSPLTTIIGSSALIGRSNLTEEQTAELAIDIASSGSRLNRIIDTFLVLARFERGQQIEVGPVSLSSLLRRLVGDTATSRHQELVTELPEQMPLVLGNDVCIEQAVRNLLSNAQKYSPPTSVITLAVSSRGAEVTISVTDQGPGVSAADAENIFEPFFRSSSTADTVTGSGIGLATSRRLAEATGARLWLESGQPGQTEFCLSLPKAPILGT